MIDLDSFRKIFYYSNFKTRSLNVLELMESIVGPVPINPSILKIPLTGTVLILFPMLISL